MRMLCPRHGQLVEMDIQSIRVFYVTDSIPMSYLVEFSCTVCRDYVLSESLGRVVGYFPGIKREPWPYAWHPVPDDREEIDTEKFDESIRRFIGKEDDDNG